MGATAHFLDIRSTGDVSLESLASIFDDGFLEVQVQIDGARIEYKSFDPPSWVQLVASPLFWGQLGVGAVVTGYLNEAGASIWKNQPAFVKFTTEKLWLLASKIVTLQQMIPLNTKIIIALPLQNEYFPAELILNDLTIDSVAFQIAALCYHQKALEAFIGSTEFNPAVGAWMELLNDGRIIFNWHQSQTLETRSQTFSI